MKVSFQEAAHDNEAVLLYVDSRGVYIPQMFAKDLNSGSLVFRPLALPGAESTADESLRILRSGPAHDDYWEAWNDVLGWEFILPARPGNPLDEDTTWYLHQDGDLWAIQVGVDIDPDSF